MPGSREIRQQFIDHFMQRHAHTQVPSSPVVPHDDPTLLFANAGMNQFKDVFLGTGTRPYTRAVNTQKCIRAGGKHNDLEDVGRDTYHHTFFEMLGNWSFGDYFKADAIEWAWDLLTRVWALPKDRLYVTVFAGDEADGVPPDDETESLWTTVTDLDPTHVSRWNRKDNFWEMANTGPCGPNSEIHIDLTADGSGGDLVNRDDPRVIELWNLVFIQFNRDRGGRLTPLPARHVDTGMGFERIAAVLQHKQSNYDTDIFAPLFEAIRDVTGAMPYTGRLDSPTDIAYRVVADHLRCLTFALSDGAHCGNEGRNYVLRRILRRAIRHGRQTLGVDRPFFYRMVPAIVNTMGETFPELRQNPGAVADELREEEQAFSRTLDRGIALFEEAAARGGNSIPATDAFRLHDTYGFPLDLTQVMAEERNMSVDAEGFEQLMEEARRRSRGQDENLSDSDSLIAIAGQGDLPETQFVGYNQTELSAVTTSLHVFAANQSCGGYQQSEQLTCDELCAVVVDQTPFYAEAGGQVGDSGVIRIADEAEIRIDNTLRAGPVIFHLGQIVHGTLETAKHIEVSMSVDRRRRNRIAANHTITHVLNRALRDRVNPDAQQRGSLVDEEKTRFDFAQHQALSPEQLVAVEQQVNNDIAADLPVYEAVAPQNEAIQINGLRAVFGEKYPPAVRVVAIGVATHELLMNPQNPDWSGYSIEFCGGTHLSRTSEAQCFCVLNEEAVAKGVRRITAVTGDAAQCARSEGESLLNRVQAFEGQNNTESLSVVTEAMADAMLPLLTRQRLIALLAKWKRKAKDQQKQQSKQAANDVVAEARKIADTADGIVPTTTGQIIVVHFETADSAPSLLKGMDVIRKKMPDAAMLLSAVTGNKIAFVATVPEPLIHKGLKAGDWVKEAAKVAGGGGGGRPDIARAGGKDPTKLGEALKAARVFAQNKLN